MLLSFFWCVLYVINVFFPYADGLNEVSAMMTLQVLFVTDSMLYNSITIRLSEMTQEAFLSHLLEYFIDALSAIVECPKENIFVFSIMVRLACLLYTGRTVRFFFILAVTSQK